VILTDWSSPAELDKGQLEREFKALGVRIGTSACTSETVLETVFVLSTAWEYEQRCL